MQVAQSKTTHLARQLTHAGVIRVAGQQPFFYTSGWASPVYVDTQVLLSDVVLRTQVMDASAEALRLQITTYGINAIVGAENSGVAFAAWLADRLNLPMLCLRKRPVGWGVNAQLSGQLPANSNVLLVDDVTTDGRSKLDACLALRQSGVTVAHVFVVVNFNVYPQAEEKLRENNLKLHYLLTWQDLFERYELMQGVPPERLQSVRAFNASPTAWSIAHGGTDK